MAFEAVGMDETTQREEDDPELSPQRNTSILEVCWKRN